MDSQPVSRVQLLLRALDRLETALARPEDDITRDACIQRFGLSFELAWKAIQRPCYVRPAAAGAGPAPRRAGTLMGPDCRRHGSW